MKDNLPCAVVRGLLPAYVEGLTEPGRSRSMEKSSSSPAKVSRGESTCLEISAVRSRASGRTTHGQ